METPEKKGDVAASRVSQEPERPTNEMRRLNEDTVKVIALLNRDVGVCGLNQYETLRRIVRDDEKLKDVYRGVVNPNNVVIEAVQVYAKRASSEAGTAGGTKMDDVFMEGSPQKVLDEVLKDILPAVISSHIQDYMAEDRKRLR